MNLRNRLEFVRGYLRSPKSVGAWGPSSTQLADMICRPFEQRKGPSRVLEVGAGTGAVTRRLVRLMDEDDELDVCEIDPDLAKALERDVLRKPPASHALEEGRIRLHCCPVQDLEGEDVYDFIVSGLPLTSFDVEDVVRVMELYQRVLKPEGVLSYFEYVGLRKLSVLASLGRREARAVSVSSLLDRKIARHQVGRVTAFVNFPPAHVRYFRFPARQPAEVAG